MNQVLLVLAVLGIVATLGAMASSVPTGILVAIFVKPFVDGAWSNLLFGQLNPGRVFGVVVPTLFLWFIVARKRLAAVPAIGIWTVYVLYALLTSLLMLVNKGPLDAIQSFYRTLNGFLGFLMFQLFFFRKADFRKLVVVFIATGVFPIGVGLYQAATGVVWNLDVTLGMTRYSGFYHDIAGLRQVILQTIVGVLLYWSYFRPAGGRTLKALLSAALVLAGVFVLFKTYSKAAILICVAWMLIWSWGRRSFGPMVAGAVLIVILNVVFADKIWDTTELLFSREVAGLDEDAAADPSARGRMLAGRVSAWENYWEMYTERPFLEKVIGDGNVRAAHNDYLASLLSGGVIGLGIYIALLWTMGSRVLRLYWRERSPLNVVSLMLFAMWLIDTIGLTPRLYPSYQWFVWGLIGLAIRGVEWGPPPARPAPPVPGPSAPAEDDEPAPSPRRSGARIPNLPLR